MTPQEKATELYGKYKILDEICFRGLAKECTLIACDEVIETWEYIDVYLADMGGELNPNLKFWYEVKNELEKL